MEDHRRGSDERDRLQVQLVGTGFAIGTPRDRHQAIVDGVSSYCEQRRFPEGRALIHREGIVSQAAIIQVYGNGLFGQDDQKTNDAQLAQIQASRFNSVILWTVHVNGSGDLSYNNTPLVTGGVFNSALEFMKPYVAALRQHGEVWWGIGSWGASDFANIGKLLSTSQGTAALTQSFRALLQALPSDGIDFDMEESYDSTMRNTIVQLTLLLDRSLQTGVTYCPYMDEPFWLNCLADVYEQNEHKQIVRRFNLQCYAGGNGNTTTAWLAKLAAFHKPLGLANVNAFIVPGNWVQSDDGSVKNSPADICAFFSNPDIGGNAGGGFLWNTSEIFGSGHDCAAYAQAVANGLANDCA